MLGWARDFSDIFHINGGILSATHKVQHRIPTADDIVIAKKQYRQPPEAREQISLQIRKQLKSEIIAPSKSPYSSPVLIVPKKLDASGERKYRVVIDYRRLNKKVIGDAYPLPNITDILDRLGKAQYFSVFDLASGYHQVETHPDDRVKTAFSIPDGHFEYQRMPMGIKNAPATFQRLMDTVLTGMLGTEAFVYLDDVVIYSETLEEHDVTARRLFKRLREANLKLQPHKCDFLCPEVAYLGHIFGREGVRPNPAKVAAIKELPRPKTVRNVRQFVGLSGYYRRFIENYAKLAKPLADLLKKEAKFIWGLEQEESFCKLRETLCQEPILRYPDFSKTFKLTTDAFTYAIGAVFTQETDKMGMSIAYYSKIMTGIEQRYEVTEKKCLAVVYAINYFRPYLYGQKFILACDQEPVYWITSAENPGPRLIRWRFRLKDYQFIFEYKKGKLNRGVEALSGNPIVEINCDPSKVVNDPARPEDPSGKSHQNERGKLIRASHPTRTVHRALPLKTKPTEMSERKRNNPIAQTKSTTFGILYLICIGWICFHVDHFGN